MFICTHCGAGDGIAFVMKFCGVDFPEAKKRIEAQIGEAKIAPPKATRGEDKIIAAKATLWRRGRLLDGSDIASRYLMSRGINPPSWPAALRWMDKLIYFDDKKKIQTETRGVIANWRSPDDKHGTLHRTYLSEPGVKAAVEKPKMFMPGPVPQGGAVRLGPAADTMGIAEGLETSLSASILFGVTVWAALSTGGMMGWIPPEGCKNVIIFGDRDENFAGQAAAYALAHRLSTKKIGVTLQFPDPEEGFDWNDALIARSR
jgi:putative DNA primase/helicase